jgi:hypothetical protein
MPLMYVNPAPRRRRKTRKASSGMPPALKKYWRGRRAATRNPKLAKGSIKSMWGGGSISSSSGGVRSAIASSGIRRSGPRPKKPAASRARAAAKTIAHHARRAISAARTHLSAAQKRAALEDLARPGNGQASPPQGSEEGRSHASSEASGRSVGPEASPSPQGVGCSEAPPPS